MTESDTEFLSRMLSQSSMPQGQAAHPDMTRLLALAAEAVRLRAMSEVARQANQFSTDASGKPFPPSPFDRWGGCMENSDE